MEADKVLQERIRCAKSPVYFLNNYGYVFDASEKKVKKMKCFNYQISCIETYHKSQNSIILKSRQCLPGDTLVDTPSGSARISELVKGDTIISYNLESDDVEIDIVSDSWCSGERECIRIEFDNCEPVESGDNHPFYEINKREWIRAIDLRAGDEILNSVKGKSIVIDTTPIGTRICYDISVERNENFLINGLLVHNTGLSVITAGYVAWRLMFRYDERILIIANDGAGARRFLATIKQFVENTPKELQPDQILTNNQTKLEFSNKSWVEAKASSPNAGRGDSLTMLVLDETAFIKDAEAIWMAAGMALSATKGKCIMISCVPENTVVLTSSGPRQIGSMVDKNKVGGYEITPYEVLGKDKLRQGNLMMNNGLHDTKIISTRNSLIEGTLVHKLWACKDGIYDWYRLENLSVGDSIAIQYGMNVWGKKTSIGGAEINNDIAYSIGLAFSGIDDPESDIELPSEIIEIIKNGQLNSDIMTLSRDKIALVLRGILDGVGYSMFQGGRVEAVLINNELARQVQILLMNYGILSNVIKSKIVIEGYSLKLLHSEIFGVQKNRGTIDVDFDDLIPYSRELFERVIFEGKIRKFEPIESEHICRAEFLRVFELCERRLLRATREKVEKILSPNIIWNKIEKIENSRKHTYDFSLPDVEGDFWCHSVIYNGVIGHQTPNGTGNLYHKTWVGSTKKDNDFVPMTVHWTQNPNSSKGLVYNKNSSGEDIPWSPWYEEECKRLNHDSVKIAQELDLSFEGSKYLVIEQHLIDRYEKRVRGLKPNFYIRYDFAFKGSDTSGSFVLDETSFHVWKRPEKGRNYLVANDVARGDGSDFSTIQVFDVESMEQVAEYKDKIGVDLFPYLIDWVGRIYNTAYVVVECNSFGLAVALTLRDALKYPRMFYSKNIQDIHVRPYDYKIPEGVEIPGFQTSVRTRPLVLKSLIEHMRENSLIINSPRLVAEFGTFVVVGNKMQHEKGYNDDLLMAAAIATYIRDTEYNNIVSADSMYKSMLGAISFSSSNMVGKISSDSNTPTRSAAGEAGIPEGGSGLFINNNQITPGSDDDLGWLLK